MNADRGGIDGHNRHLRQLHPLVQQGISGDLIATREGFSREDCDTFALSSQQRYARAHTEGRLKKSLIPVRDADGTRSWNRMNIHGQTRRLRDWVNCRRPLQTRRVCPKG